MATSVEAAERAAAHSSGITHALVAWVQGHRQVATYASGALLLGVLLFAWNTWSSRQTEVRAGAALSAARSAFESRNYPLAASELARLVENYAGTNAAEEGTLLLANVRIQQGQVAQAIELLQRLAPSASRSYQAQAYGLLAAALETQGQLRPAAEAYEEGSKRAVWDWMKAQLLAEAGRVWGQAGDTTRAVASYARVVKDFGERGPATEAKVRLGELTKGAWAP
ncbi:MAG: tetratricopeptide repeat protein [Gemmatimonadales bacterium]